MVRVTGVGWVWPVTWSVTSTAKMKMPGVVGTPEMVPAEERLSPGGREPEVTDQSNGAWPPVDASESLYAEPCAAAGSAVVVITKGYDGAMTSVS